MALLKRSFRPEFLNRIDETVVFNPLSREDIARIVDIQLGELQTRLTDEGVEVIISQRVRQLLAEEGFDPDFGARPLKRTIQRMLENPLARLILESGPTRVVVSTENGKIELKPEG